MATVYINSYNFPPGKILLSSTPGPAATITTYSGYIVFKFTASATLNVGTGSPGTADVFVLAGGSPGGNSFLPNRGGGGGAGGVRAISPGFSISANSPIPVVVGGASTNSTFGPVTSSGGTSGGTGGAPGGVGGAGGNGPTNEYETGSSQNYGGGGGGGGGAPFRLGGPGGSSGGGPGGLGTTGGFAGNPGSGGGTNTGGGGGGGGYGTAPIGFGGSGGSGIVIVRFPDSQFRTS